MNRRDFLLALALGTAAADCAAFDWPFRTGNKRKSLLLAGSNTMLALNQALAAEFSKLHPLVDVVVEKGGSLPGLIALKRGAIDIAAMARDITALEDETRILNFLIARNDITIVVNRKLPVKSLSRGQIRALLTGAITNWKQVGGPNAPIHVVSRIRGSTSRQFVEEVVLGGRDITASARNLPSAQKLAESVAADPYAIGFISLKDSKGIADVSSLQVDGVTASRRTVLSDRYPYTQSLYLVLSGKKDGPASDFVAFARSPAGQAIVEQQRMVPVY